MQTAVIKAAAGLIGAACLAGLAVQPANAAAAGTAGKFDFYVLALSWSPGYCATAGKHANKRECGPASKYGFIVHGLWPQAEAGHPENCTSSFPARVPQALGEKFYDIMPGMGLIGHEWRAHGTCTGLSQKAYFALLRRAREKITVPAELTRSTAPREIAPAAVEEAFLKVNPGLKANEIAVSCSAANARLEDVRICLTKDLDFRACPAVDAEGCSKPRLSTSVAH